MEQDIRMLPEASAFDLIVACEVLEHIENDTDVLNLISKRLSTEGNLLLSVPAFMSKWESGDTFAGHFRRYERDEIVAKIQAAGMAVDKLWMFGFPICQLTYPLREAYYAMKLRSTKLSKEDATKQSGVNRALARKLHQLPMAKLLSPFFKLQRLVRHTNVGDGFLVLARKMAT